MRHAGPAALDALADLIAATRARHGLREPRPGVFYRNGRAWLHFHEDPSGLYADLREGAEWTRFRVSTPAEREALASAIEGRAGARPTSSPSPAPRMKEWASAKHKRRSTDGGRSV